MEEMRLSVKTLYGNQLTIVKVTEIGAGFATFCALRHYSDMLQLLLALGLTASAPPPAPCCHAAAPRLATVAADASEEWRDNALHYVVPAVWTLSSYGVALELGAERKEARWIAIGTGVLAIVAKEIYDQSVAGRFGLEETAIGLAGVATGILIAERVVWPEEKRAQ